MPQRREVTQFSGSSIHRLIQLMGCILRAKRQYPSCDDKLAWDTAINMAQQEYGWAAARTAAGLKAITGMIAEGRVDDIARIQKITVYNDGSSQITVFSDRPPAFVRP